MEFIFIIFIIFFIYLIFFRKKKTNTKYGDSVLFPDSTIKSNVGKIGKSKIFMCIKDLKWTIESMPGVDRAYILAMATAIRLTMLKNLFAEMNLSEDLLKNPKIYNDNELFTFYTEFEKIRNQSTAQRLATEKNLKKMGMPMPEYAKGHAIASERALEVWMCTLAIGIIEDKKRDIEKIWGMLMESSDLLENAITKIQHHSDKTEQDTGIRDGIFDDIYIDEWAKEGLFMPNF